MLFIFFFFSCQQLSVFSKNGKVQKRGKINLVGRLQLSTEKSQEEDNEGIMQLRILRVQVSVQSSKKINFNLGHNLQLVEGLSWSWEYSSWIYNCLCNQCISPLKLLVRIPFGKGVLEKQHYVIKFVSDLRHVDWFLCVLRFPPPIKLTTTI